MIPSYEDMLALIRDHEPDHTLAPALIWAAERIAQAIENHNTLELEQDEAD